MKELSSIQIALNAPKGEVNKFGGYKYRTCESILQAAKPLLKQYECSLTMSDSIVEVGGRIYIVSKASLVNKDGEVAESTGYARESESKKGMDDAQVTGAASSYARKYALCGLLAIDGADDPDRLNVTKEYTAPTEPEVVEYAPAVTNTYSEIFKTIEACTTRKELCALMKANNTNWKGDEVITKKCHEMYDKLK